MARLPLPSWLRSSRNSSDLHYINSNNNDNDNDIDDNDSTRTTENKNNNTYRILFYMLLIVNVITLTYSFEMIQTNLFSSSNSLNEFYKSLEVNANHVSSTNQNAQELIVASLSSSSSLSQYPNCTQQCILDLLTLTNITNNNVDTNIMISDKTNTNTNTNMNTTQVNEMKEQLQKCLNDNNNQPVATLSPSLSPSPLPSPESEKERINVVSIATENIIMLAYIWTRGMRAHCERCNISLILMNVPDDNVHRARFSAIFDPSINLYFHGMPREIIELGPKGAGGDGTFVKFWIEEFTGLSNYWYIDIDTLPLHGIQDMLEKYYHEPCVLQSENGMTHGAIFKCRINLDWFRVFLERREEATQYFTSLGWGLSDQPIIDWFYKKGIMKATLNSLGVYNCLSSRDHPFYLIHMSGDKMQYPARFHECVANLQL